MKEIEIELDQDLTRKTIECFVDTHLDAISIEYFKDLMIKGDEETLKQALFSAVLNHQIQLALKYKLQQDKALMEDE